MIIDITREGYTSDLLVSGTVPLPIDFQFVVGNGVSLTMHGGMLRGTLMIVEKEKELQDCYRCAWTCPGSQYDGREFLLSPGLASEVGGAGQTLIVPSPYQLIPIT